MADKKVIDDYYLQSSSGSGTGETSDDEKNKPKGVIRRKIKLKTKEPESPVVSASSEQIQAPKKEEYQEKAPQKEKIQSTQTPRFEKKESSPRAFPPRNTWFHKKDTPYKPPFSPPNPADQRKETSYSHTSAVRPQAATNTTASFDKKPSVGMFAKKKTFWNTRFGESDENKKAFKKDKSNKHKKWFFHDEDDGFSRSNKIKNIKKEEKKVEDIKQDLTDRTWEVVIIPEILSLKELSEKMWTPLMKLMTEFIKNGMKVTINSKIDFESASIIAEGFSIKLQKDVSSGFWVEDVLAWDITTLLAEEDSDLLEKRPPVISIMGHVDHGKTSLLDYLRKTKVADKEAGGITQSIWAYQVEYKWEKITFLDTPWHEAFTIMRARGAKSTDIAILVVAADEWVKPQTVESINHAIEANIKIVVAITKIDKPGANIDNVKSGLSSHGLLAEDWGGEIPMVGISSKTGEGIDDLLEIILLVAEMEGFKANPERLAVGTVLESHLNTKLGPVSTLLINTGSLKKWDSIVCKGSYGKVKMMKWDLGKNIDVAGPSTPVLVVGFDSVCSGWDIVQVVSDIEKARMKALEYMDYMSSKSLKSSTSLDLIMSKIKSGNLKQLKIVLKSDTNGSLEAIKWALAKLSTPETRVTIIHSWVGNITEWDVLMCQWSSAILIGYNVELLWNTKNIIDESKIEFISSKIIYHITERIEKIITGMLDPKEVEVPLGEAKVWGIFYEGADFMILGLKLGGGSKLVKWAWVKIIRKDKYLGSGKVENLKSWIIDVGDIEGPVECGIKLKTTVKVELGDILEIFIIEKQK